MRDEPYCLFLDELNACSHEVQKAFYSLVLDRRIGEFTLPAGTVVIGAGNRSRDQAIARPLSSALVNRLLHVQLRASARDRLAWARGAGVDPLVIASVETRSDHLWARPPKHEEPFSTPRSWHMLSLTLAAHGPGIGLDQIKVLAQGLLTPAHAQQFATFVKLRQRAFALAPVRRTMRQRERHRHMRKCPFASP